MPIWMAWAFKAFMNAGSLPDSRSQRHGGVVRRHALE